MWLIKCMKVFKLQLIVQIFVYLGRYSFIFYTAYPH